MLAQMTDPFNSKSMKLESGENAAVLINNMGGTSTLEEWIFCGEFIKILGKNEKREVL